MPIRPMIVPPVGKSGPGMMRSMAASRSGIDACGCSIDQMTASTTSRRLCGGMFVAMPTAMPDEPLMRRLGMRAGRTTGSLSVSS